MNEFLVYLSQLTGLQPATLVLLGGIIVTISGALSRVIPNDATGFLGFIRVVASLIGIAPANRITSGVTVNDVAQSLLSPHDSKEEVTEQLKASGVLPDPSAGIAGVTRASNGRFQKVNSGWIVGLLALVIALMMLTGCKSLSDANIAKNLCQNQIVARSVANKAMAAALLIKNPALRESAIGDAQTVLDLIDACPPIGSPVALGGVY